MRISNFSVKLPKTAREMSVLKFENCPLYTVMFRTYHWLCLDGSLHFSSNFTFLIASPSVISFSWLIISTFPCCIPTFCKLLAKWKGTVPAPCRALLMLTPEIARAEFLGCCANTLLLCLQVGRSYIKKAGDPPGLCLPAVQNSFQLGCLANLQH